jgi:hypothetical protein
MFVVAAWMCTITRAARFYSTRDRTRPLAAIALLRADATIDSELLVSRH